MPVLIKSDKPNWPYGLVSGRP